MSLKIKSLSLKQNFVHLFWGSTFWAGLREVLNINFFSLCMGPGQKVPPKNKFTKFISKDKDFMFKFVKKLL